MTPVELKKMLIHAVQVNDPQLALEVAKEIVAKDLYINVPTGVQRACADAKLVNVQWGGKPCQGRCNALVEHGAAAVWVKGIGVWHPECWTEAEAQRVGVPFEEVA